MIKKILYLTMICLLVAFVIQNNVHVPVVFLTGKAHLRAVFLMLLCFACGFFMGYYFVFRKEDALWIKIRHLKLLLAKEKKKQRQHLDED